MRALPFPVRRVSPHLFGPPLPALGALWQAGGRRGVTAAVCVVLPLSAGVVLGRPDLGAAGSLCAFTAIYGHALPYRRRAVVVAAVGATLTVASVLGALSGGHPVALSLVAGGLALGATAATAVWRVGPPGPIGVALVCGGSSALGTAHGQLAFHLLAAGGGALLSWCACMLPWFWDPSGPERRALVAAERAVAARETGGAGAPRPGAVAAAVRLADTALSDSRSSDDTLRRRLHEVEQRFLRALPPADDVAVPVPPPAAGPAPAQRWWHQPWRSTAIRIGAGAAVAGLVATAFGLHNPYWAATTAVAVQLGTGARQTRVRALHRATGTVLGVLIAGLLIWADLPVGVSILLVGLMQLTVELLVAHKYGLAVTFITPLVLLLVHIGVPTRSGIVLIGERLAETGVGIAVALLAGLTLFPRAGSRRLPAVVTAATAATLVAARERAGPEADRRLHDALVPLTDVATATRAELFTSGASTAWLHRARHVADLGWGLLGARARGDEELAATLTRRITEDLDAAGR